MIYHILGSNIPHHNRTVLTFFSQEITSNLPLANSEFYLVSSENLQVEFPTLKIRCFPSKRTLAKAVVEKSTEAQAIFLLHGQFNFYLWFAILTGKLPVQRVIWHIWGADLYESSTNWRFKLLYPIRRLAQHKLPEIWATRGDLAFAHSHLNRATERDKVLYFPTKMLPFTPKMQEKNRLTILLGNSGDPSNQHLLGLDYLFQQFGKEVNIIIPMGYPVHNQRYLARVERHSKRLFPSDNVQILQEKLPLEDYLQCLEQCDLGLFLFERQQGISTICALIERNIPVVLRYENPFCLDLQTENVPFLVAEQSVDLVMIEQVKTALKALDKTKIGFFPPNYLPQWISALRTLEQS